MSRSCFLSIIEVDGGCENGGRRVDLGSREQLNRVSCPYSSSSAKMMKWSNRPKSIETALSSHFLQKNIYFSSQACKMGKKKQGHLSHFQSINEPIQLNFKILEHAYLKREQKWELLFNPTLLFFLFLLFSESLWKRWKHSGHPPNGFKLRVGWIMKSWLSSHTLRPQKL